jgi:hypothetical protein
MAITATRVSVGSTAVALNTASGMAGTLTVRNGSWIGGDGVVLGPSDVTATTGYDLRAGESVSIPLKANDVLYAIAGAGAGTVLVSSVLS